MITYTKTKTVKPAETKTCFTCPKFNNYGDSRQNGWCNLLDRHAKATWEQSNNCILNITAEQENNPTTFASINLNELEAFPTKVIELDREGYPMGKETVENGYFDQNFVTYPNEPF